MLKRKLGLVFAAAMTVMMFASCLFVDNNGTTGGSTEVKECYNDFYNYPTGKQDAKGTLTLTNESGTAVLCFVDSVKGQNYIGTINGGGSIQVKLDGGKFYSIVTVSKEKFEEKGEYAKSSSELAFYDDVQKYTVKVKANGAIGDAYFMINNPTSYWASIENVDGSGEKFAVVKPGAQRVKVAVSKDQNYDYKIVYYKEIKYNGTIMGIAEKTDFYENDTASFLELTEWAIDCKGPVEKSNSDLAPTIFFINDCKKSVRLYNGKKQLCAYNLEADDYISVDGMETFFTGFTAGKNLNALTAKSTGWTDNSECYIDCNMEKGYVYTVKITPNPNYKPTNRSGSDPVVANNNPCIWTLVAVTDAETFYADSEK